jgi:hypothetical protein
MLETLKRLTRGIILEPLDSGPNPKTDSGFAEEGMIYTYTNRIKAYIQGALREVLTADQSQTVTNKSIDSDNNTITNIVDADIKAAAAIDATKIADGSVTDAEFQYIGGLTSDAQTQIDANETAISDHIADAVAAHAGSAIANTPSGNLAATDVQGALDELQTDVDTRALGSDLTTHISDTSTHGVTGDVLGTTDTQDISGKTFTDFLQVAEVGTPATPASGFARIYPKTDGNIYAKNDAGTELTLSTSGALPDVVTEFRRTGTISSVSDTILVDSDTAFTSVTVTQQGSAGAPEITDFVCKADTAGSLNNRVGYLYSAADATQYYIWFNVNSEGTDPSYAGMTGIEVAVATGAADTAVASAMQTAVDALGDFGASVSTNTVTVTNASNGVTTDASNDSIVLTLPTAVGIEGKKFNIVKTDDSDTNFLIDGDGSETVDGSTTLDMRLTSRSAVIESDNVGWVYIAGEIYPRVAYVKDVKSNGTNGGTFTSGSWQTRDLTVTEGDDSIVTLGSNQFTLPAGDYRIEASAPGYRVEHHKIKVRNISDSTDDIIGSNAFSDDYFNAGNSSSEQTNSVLSGKLLIDASKTFELQHRSASTLASTGFGLANTFSVDEVYSQVKITKVR